jgi:tRNA(Met) cytidine acetyltransferase
VRDLTLLGERLRADAIAARQRRLVVLEGSLEWSRGAASALVSGCAPLWLGDAPEGAERQRPDRARRLLGRTTEALIFDLHWGVDPDSMAAGVLSVLPGGLVILRCPSLSTWTRDGLEARLAVSPHPVEAVGSRFLNRFKAALGRASAVFLREDGGFADRSPAAVASPFVGEEQEAAVAAILDHAAGGPGPILLFGDRGRGKSTALGIAAGQIDGPVLLTGPGPSTLASVSQRFGDAVYTTPEDLLLRPHDGFLIVDEAAALGLPTLELLLQRHPRAALAATVHGYEGTGDGFVDSFRRSIDAQEVVLKEAPRWSSGDPVEAFTFDALLLDADPEEGVEGATVDECEVVQLDRDDLDDSILRPLLGLLIMAHYRTRPSDLRRLLDGPNLQIWASFCEGRLVAGALVADEGGLPPDEAAAIHEGLTRPRGHLIPETLIAHANEEASAGLKGRRIVRIATHPAVQGRGIGAQLLSTIVAQPGVSWFGAQFGATEARLRAFANAGLRPVWTSALRGRSSGLRTCLSMLGVDGGGREMVRRLRRRFSVEAVYAMGDASRDEDPDLLTALLHWGPATRSRLSGSELEEAVACAWGPRRLEGVRGPLVKLAAEAMRDGRIEELSHRQRRLVIERVLQARPWSELLPRSQFGSEHPTRRALKRAIQTLLMTEPGALDLAVRFPETERLRMAKRHHVPLIEGRLDKIRRVVADRWSDVELVLEEVWDAHNAAAVLRSADAFGVGRVHMVYGDEVFPELPLQTSGGVKRWMDLREVESAEALVADLKRRGRTIVATALREDAVPLWELDCTGPMAIVFGNEHSGVSQTILDAADRCVIVPMAGMAQSLNISVSAGIVLSEVGRQRQGMENPWDAGKEAMLQRWLDREVDPTA